jgi:hypothetical protein
MNRPLSTLLVRCVLGLGLGAGLALTTVVAYGARAIRNKCLPLRLLTR